jgi:hypothetical protein
MKPNYNRDELDREIERFLFDKSINDENISKREVLDEIIEDYCTINEVLAGIRKIEKNIIVEENLMKTFTCVAYADGYFNGVLNEVDFGAGD